MNGNGALLELLARYHQQELRRAAEAARLASLLGADRGFRLRQRLGRALIRLGGLLAEADAARHAERA